MSSSKYKIIDSLSLQDFDENSELIPLMTTEDEEVIKNESLPKSLPILSLRNTVLFPGVVIPITAGRDKSIKLINDANKGSKVIGVLSQKDETVEDPKFEDLYRVGTVARILKVLKMPDGNTTVIIQGKKRFEIEEPVSDTPYMTAKIKDIKEIMPAIDHKEFKAAIESIKDLSLEIIKQSPSIPSEASFAIKNIESNSFLINFVSSNMGVSVVEKQKLLEINDLHQRALQTLKHMNVEFQRLELKNDIQSKVQSDMSQQQREYFLQQQIKTIQEELGGVSYEEEIEAMKKKAASKSWDKKTEQHFEKEIGKLQRMNPQVAEYSIQRNYLDLYLELPWNHFSKDNLDLRRAQKILDRDHFGLEEVKKRIVEYLAVLKLRND
ncbi:MAG: LON peptidase substrate-binding domain-containing protein, partial [Bacteroidota bacterium]|nr:LON peptidase substrate-binding domain-containing protein [Bacteroidota bacterium]